MALRLDVVPAGLTREPHAAVGWLSQGLSSWPVPPSEPNPQRRRAGFKVSLNTRQVHTSHANHIDRRRALAPESAGSEGSRVGVCVKGPVSRSLLAWRARAITAAYCRSSRTRPTVPLWCRYSMMAPRLTRSDGTVTTVIRKAAWSPAMPEDGWSEDLRWYAAAVHQMKLLTPGLDQYRPLALRANFLAGLAKSDGRPEPGAGSDPRRAAQPHRAVGRSAVARLPGAGARHVHA